MRSRLELTRSQILGFRRLVGALDQRLAPGGRSLRRAAWAGLQDSMPRAALLSIHARVEETQPSTWEDPSLVQLWGPRGNVFVARRPTVGTVPAPAVDPRDARLELARRYLHTYGPTTAEAFAWWAGLRPRHGVAVFQALGSSLTPVQTPVGEAWILSRDEPTLRAAHGAVVPARLLPSLQGRIVIRWDN